MKITILAVGKLKEKYLRDGVAEYTKRLAPFAKLEILEIAEEKMPENVPRRKRKRRSSARASVFWHAYRRIAS